MSGGAAQTVARLKARAEKLGFDAFGIASATARPDLPARLAEALDAGFHGDMDWMAETADRRRSPQALWAKARSVIMVGLSYAPAHDPLAALESKTHGNISAYARNRDYHGLIKGRLKELAGLIARDLGAEVKVFVDTAPVMEKPLAEAAGLGWQGKHSVLVSRDHGSWLFLGAIFTDAELPADAPHPQRCGSCQSCLDICPTDAFSGPFRLDARKCLAYWTVEAKGQIPRAYRAPMGNRIFGCDDCLAVCPWNKFASETREAKLRARSDLEAPALADLARLDEPGFRALFAGSPVKRLGHERFLRNVLVAIGNSGDPGLLSEVVPHLGHSSPLARGAAVWAVRRLGSAADIARFRRSHLATETDREVRAEWEGALTPPLPGTASRTEVPA